nr:ankyrin repeat domain-containing protein 26-like isoform X2 [Microcebus murinus]
MKKFLAFGRKEGKGESSSFGSVWKTLVGAADEVPQKAYTKTLYNIHPEDLKPIHGAACRGDVEKVRRLLWKKPWIINDKDSMHRTALHLASANGRAEVVKLLVDNQCKLNRHDRKKRTPLIKAVQCQEEECVTVLLEDGADPNVHDLYGNTALHYAAYHQNIAIAEKLLSHGAFIDPKNKIYITPLLLAISEKREEMVDFLVKAGANINAVDKLKRNALMLATDSESSHIVSLLQQSGDVSSEVLLEQAAEDHDIASDFNSIPQQTSEHEEENILENSSQNSDPENEITEDPVFRISIKPGINDFWLESFVGHFDDDTKNVLQPGLIKPMTASQQPMKMVQAKCIRRTDDGTFFEDSIFNHPHVVQSFPTSSVEVQGFHNTSIEPPGPGVKAFFKSSTKEGCTEEERAKPGTAKKENGIGIIENASQEQKNYVNFTVLYKNSISDKMSALGSPQKEDEESPWDSDEEEEIAKPATAEKENGIGVIENAPREQKNNINFTVMHENSTIDKRCLLGSGPKEDEESPWDSDDEELTANPSTTKMENGIGIIENAPQVQNTSGSFTAVCHHNRSGKMSALVSGENEVVEVRLDSTCESISKNPLQKDVGPSSMAVDQKGRNTVNGQIEGSYHENLSSSPHRDRASKVYLKEELQQDMQKFKNEVDMLQEEFPAVEKEKVPLEKEFEEGRKEHKNNEMKVSENLYDGVANVSDNEGSFEQRKRGRTGLQHFPRKKDKECDSGPASHIKEVKKNGNEKRTSNKSMMTAMFEKPKLLTGGLLPVNDDSNLREIEQDEGRPAMKTSNKKNKVKHKIRSMGDIDDLTGSSEIALEDHELPYSAYKQFMLLIKQLGKDCKHSVSLMKIQDAFLSQERIIEINKNYCERLRLKLEKTRNKVGILQKELSKTEEIKSHLEHQEVVWEHELCTARFTLKEEEEKRRNAERLYEQMREGLRRKEEECKREAEVKQQLELTLKKQNEELQTLRTYLSQICHSQEREKDLLHKNRMLQEQIAMLRMERDKIKSQNEEIEKKYLKDMKITKEKDDDAQINIILNLETLTKTGSQYGEQLCVLTAENAMLKCKLESETQNKERLKEEVASYHSRLTATSHDLDESETSRKHLELAFHTARDEWFHLQDKMNFYISNLKENNEILSEKLSKAESKIGNLEKVLHHTRELLQEKTFLEDVQRDLRQTQCQTKEIEQTYRSDQGKVNSYIGKQGSLEQRLSELQRENMLLRQQPHAADNKAAQKEETGTNIQDSYQDIMKQSQAESDKQSLLLEGKLQELVNECDHLKERMCHLEKESAERKVLVSHLQELATTLTKQPMSEAFAEVSPCHINLEDETPGSMKILHQIRSQIDQLKQALEFPCSKCQHLNTKNQVVQPESLSMEITRKKYKKLQENKKKLKQAIVDLRNYMERNMIDRGQVAQYKREIEANARQTIVEQLKEINLFLQEQAAQQEKREELRENQVASVKNEMELRVKVLESERHKMKMSQEEFNNVELEKYKLLYEIELEAKKSLACKPKT